MASNRNIFCATNPAKLCDALWSLLDGRDFSNDIIFLPSRRAVRTVEKMITEKVGGAVMLPRLVALGEADDESPESPAPSPEIVSNNERVLVLAKLLSADPNIRNISNAMPIAKDLVRMQDYIENEIRNKDQGSWDRDWLSLVDEKYAAHFRKKAEFLSLADSVLPKIFPNKITVAQKRNADIRGWEQGLGTGFGKIIICGSTASVPATADLMAHVAGMPNGYIILPGKIKDEGIWMKDDVNETSSVIRHPSSISNPYFCELKFLERIGVSPADVNIIDVGESNIDFFNIAFSNTSPGSPVPSPVNQFARIDCQRESDEAAAVANIAANAVANNKSVLVITPDAAGNQRIAAEFVRRGLVADFSGGISGAMTLFGRNILNKIDELIELAISNQQIANLFDFVEGLGIEYSEDAAEIILAIADASDILVRHGIAPTLLDARAIIASALSSVSVRDVIQSDARIRVLGTVESRMQTADVVILTGLNEGMFPANGYENAWLPKSISEKIGLPPAARKVSLMAMDFITLSCGPQVYWTRSKTAAGAITTESRFLSRVKVVGKSVECRVESVDKFKSSQNSEINNNYSCRDNLHSTLYTLHSDYPAPPADRSDVYITDIELLIHNPFAYYCKHILRLRPARDYWAEPDARDFGNLVHGVIEEIVKSVECRVESVDKFKSSQNSEINNNDSCRDNLHSTLSTLHSSCIVDMLDSRAKQVLEPGSVMFHFWHKRFVEIAPAIEKLLQLKNIQSEIELQTVIAGRKVKARADMVFDDTVLDIKTGAAPNRAQLLAGNMPQLPLEAFMRGARVMQFLQLQNNNVRMIEYSGDIAKQMIDASVQKVSELFGRYAKDFESYEYYETSDAKYKAFDDLARVDS